jgi:hypothetical protein
MVARKNTVQFDSEKATKGGIGEKQNTVKGLPLKRQ